MIVVWDVWDDVCDVWDVVCLGCCITFYDLRFTIWY